MGDQSIGFQTYSAVMNAATDGSSQYNANYNIDENKQDLDTMNIVVSAFVHGLLQMDSIPLFFISFQQNNGLDDAVPLSLAIDPAIQWNGRRGSSFLRRSFLQCI